MYALGEDKKIQEFQSQPNPIARELQGVVRQAPICFNPNLIQLRGQYQNLYHCVGPRFQSQPNPIASVIVQPV